MNPAQKLHGLGRSLWLDNITRGLPTSGTLRRYIGDLSVTGLTSNPSIFDLAIKDSTFCDDAIRQKTDERKAGETLFFELEIEDLTQAADLFRPIHDATAGVDGWVSFEVSPLLTYDTANTVKAAVALRTQAHRDNLFIGISGTTQGIAAIEDAIFFAGVPVNVTLLFSSAQYLAAAEADLRGIERRAAAGLDPKVRSVASMFISRRDKALMGKVPRKPEDRLGIATAKRTYKAYRDLLASPCWLNAFRSGAQPRRLLWASTGTKDPRASDVFYVKALAAPDTINTIPEKTLLAFADHGAVGDIPPVDGGDVEKVITASSRPALTMKGSPPVFSGKVRTLLSRTGKICSIESRPGPPRSKLRTDFQMTNPPSPSTIVPFRNPSSWTALNEDRGIGSTSCSRVRRSTSPSRGQLQIFVDGTDVVPGGHTVSGKRLYPGNYLADRFAAAIDESVPAAVPGAALYERRGSRGEDRFGGHEENAAVTKADA